MKKRKSKTKKEEPAKKEKVEVKKKSNKTKILAVVAIVLIVIAVFLVLNKPRTVQQGDVALIDYVGSTEGVVFDTNIASVAKENGIYNERRNYKPLEMTVGAGRYIKGFEDAVYGMKEGETKTVLIPPELAYGKYDPRNLGQFSLEGIEGEVKVGSVLTDEKGNVLKVVQINGTHALADLNHPLAGKTLEFKITLVKIKND